MKLCLSFSDNLSMLRNKHTSPRPSVYPSNSRGEGCCKLYLAVLMDTKKWICAFMANHNLGPLHSSGRGKNGELKSNHK